MANFRKMDGDIQDKAVLEYLQAAAEKQQADISYVAMMADVDLPEDGEEEGGEDDE